MNNICELWCIQISFLINLTFPQPHAFQLTYKCITFHYCITVFFSSKLVIFLLMPCCQPTQITALDKTKNVDSRA